MRLYEVTADYRPANPNKPKYYVVADNKKDAKAKFSAVISWLKIYAVELVNEEFADYIISKPEKYIVIGD